MLPGSLFYFLGAFQFKTCTIPPLFPFPFFFWFGLTEGHEEEVEEEVEVLEGRGVFLFGFLGFIFLLLECLFVRSEVLSIV